MNVIVTAGGEIERDQALYAAVRGGLKAMVDIAGKPMIQWVLDALSQSNGIKRVVVAGLPPETDLVCAQSLVLVPDYGDRISNIQAAAREIRLMDPRAEYALLLSDDIPALRGEAVDWLLCQIKDPPQDFYFTLVERLELEALLPGFKRTYTKLKDAHVCNGELHCLRLDALTEENPLWKRLVESRKSPLRQANILGYDTMFFLMLHQLTLQAAEATVCKKLGIQGQALLSPYPEVGLHVTKPHQLTMMREYLSRRRDNDLSRGDRSGSRGEPPEPKDTL